MQSRPRFIQGVFAFVGKGLDAPVPLEGCPTYVVPPGVVTQPLYFRAGNSSDALLTLVLLRDGKPSRYFPVAAQGDAHVSLRVVEDLDSGTQLQIDIAAPEGVQGHVVLDVGLVEV